MFEVDRVVEVDRMVEADIVTVETAPFVFVLIQL
jgi:hypothetical protein